ncbi:hypothetical protein FB192DRAFT_1380558 [Mucor lusitanicus]|uniref:Uncharacterized protein n=2 Tax=Mucor circinelloides f. lusitanicus TaxID=29924 RepID=A0A162R863_MUCCL|nr:hypothetical protein FB192DRAFT_1380558 [Mucor lusitanicus]OAD09180.1 hypothetical protein MUCCIDRAFT_106161 [Mucor lusitanicus CBS 277.49]
MTLVAIYYSPPSANAASSKVKTTTINSNFTSKWKKGIALLSSKYSHKRKYQCSPTTIAAATEKVLCHSKNNSPHNHIKCEDLTAKEFARMAGIKIKSDDDEAAEGDDEMIDFVSVTATTAPAQQHYLSIVDEPMTTQMTSVSTRTALSSKSCHQIWDSDFWQCNDNSNNNKLIKTSTNTTANTAKTNTNNNNNDTLFISRLRSCSSSVENSNNMTVPGVIQKGRFKIVVGQDDCCEPVTQHHHVVLEWKRKRSDSSSTSLTTKKKQPM